jgi:ATP-dependent helicase/nuclease subunit A
MNLDRNIVIEASAGTGKTYTLVQTILQALFQKNLPMESLVALTFTKKAAGEMKERIAAKLQEITAAEAIDESWRVWGLPLDSLKDRARAALETIDRASIGTIHSYAFSLLKRFPLESGISPEAEVDDKGVKADEMFEEDWPKWLRQQLSAQSAGRSTQENSWLEVLERVSLKDIRDLARRLSDFDIPLECLPLSDANLKQAIEPFLKNARQFAATKPEKLKSTQIAAAIEEVLSSFLAPSPVGRMGEGRDEGPHPNPLPPSAGEGEVSKDTLSLLDETPTGSKEWPPEDLQRLKTIRAVALNLLRKGDRTLALTTGLLKPFITAFRGRQLSEGYLSNNALLVLARDLVANNLGARETLKKQIRLIFIDEFQDTDPLQGELLLFMAEELGQDAKHWQKVKLEPGKLFIVGDPKQSIYRFRGADIGAYASITKLVLDQGGIRHTLDESYRSHAQILHVVNAAFEPLIQEKHPISPAYQPLVPRRQKTDENHVVEIRLASSKDPQTSEDALEKEARDAAVWITTAVTEKRWLFKDIALIFRSTPSMTPFIDALRAADIPFVVEGERYFYQTPEVTDVLNLLRVVDDPKNRIALAGFLRSPLGGFTDAELALLQEKNGLKLHQPLPKELDGAAHSGAWERLRKLHSRAGRQPLKQVLTHVYEDTYLMELAARSYHRDQTIANLFKLKRLMESLAEEGETTLHGLLAKIDRYREDDRLEGESPLADDTFDAVRLLTIHKAKGLEFPVVWLPGLHRGGQNHRPSQEIGVRYDWGTHQLGLTIPGKARNIADFALDAEGRARDEAEELRVLYVAMTRPRDTLILSGGTNLKRPSKGSFLSLLGAAWNLDLDKLKDGELKVGETTVTLRKFTERASPAVAPKREGGWLDSLNPGALAKTWQEREKNCEKAMESRLLLTPSGLNDNAGRGARDSGEGIFHEELPPPASRVPRPEFLGSLIHRFLEHWDFKCEKCDMPARLRVVANHYLASLGLLVKPFPDPKIGKGEENPKDLIELVEEAQRLLADFIDSDDYEDIKKSTILGREVPFFYATGPAVMRGAIDILYRTKGGQLVIGDYKTGLRTEDSELKYSAQGSAYAEAVSRALGEKAIFKLIYLREEAEKIGA